MPSTPLILGISGSRQGPAAALIGARALAACEESRLSRMRITGNTRAPTLSVAALLDFVGAAASDIRAVGATSGGQLADAPLTPVDHQRAHATYAFYSSPFDDAAIVVCDSSTEQGWTAWRGSAGGLVPIVEDLGRFPMAAAYSQLTTALGLAAGRDEHIVESLARVGTRDGHPISDLMHVGSSGMTIDARWLEHVSAARDTHGSKGTPAQTSVAAAAQARMADALLELLARVHRATGATRACLAGGLFYNTHFTTVAATRGPFGDVFVPAHPGNAGAAIGAALDCAMTGAAATAPGAWRPDLDGDRERIASPFLGPSYSPEHVKETLDNCKLSYAFLDERRLDEQVVDALAQGGLVGWFNGRMEWGPRALGHRSVLASPNAEHVLDNMNGFLKKRPWYGAYGVSVPRDRVHEFFEGPAESRYMQFEYRPRDPEQFRWLLPPGARALRVHTVDESEPRLLRLLGAWEARSGTPVLVNTSFNGFHEPLVCSPRDAVRVFYGTGLDMLAIERFALRK